jgi:hypothetical protein
MKPRHVSGYSKVTGKYEVKERYFDEPIPKKQQKPCKLCNGKAQSMSLVTYIDQAVSFRVLGISCSRGMEVTKRYWLDDDDNVHDHHVEVNKHLFVDPEKDAKNAWAARIAQALWEGRHCK